MMSRRNVFVLLTLVLLLTVAAPSYAATESTDMPRFATLWETFWSWVPWPSPPAPQKNGPGLDPNGNDVGYGTDPDGFAASTQPQIDHGPGIDPNGGDVGYGPDPNG